jgi:hypothetical protein
VWPFPRAIEWRPPSVSSAPIRTTLLLIDRSHKNWLLATLVLAAGAVLFYAAVAYRTPGPLTGGSLVGMWYGLAGFGLMLFAGALSLLRKVPSWWWLGSRKAWLKGHIWLGLLSGVLILCHSGFRWGGLLETVLMVLVGLVLVSGVAGLLLQQVVPHLIATRLPREAPYEQIPYLCTVLRSHADELMATIEGDAALNENTRAVLRIFHADEMRPFLGSPFRAAARLANPLRAQTVFTDLRALPGLTEAVKGHIGQLEAWCDERRQLGEQERWHHLLHGWLLAHVPLSVLLLVLGLVHAFFSLYY